jgi:hypothetical protein
MRTKFLLESLKGRDCSRLRRRLEDNIKMDPREIVLEGVN